jgi:SAM-dependent methyltransferase
MINQDSLYVQYGCGEGSPEGWINFDASPTLKIQKFPIIGNFIRRNKIKFPKSVKFGDVRKGLPIASESCAGVYASHVLEHLSLKDFHIALDETYRILRPGGRFRAIVPDISYYCKIYLNEYESGSAFAASNFMRQTHLGYESRSVGLLGAWLASLQNSRHLWMWDYYSLSNALVEHGFTDVRLATFGDSVDRKFDLVESESRFINACAIDCIR